jgi:S1-C subfamily serine protease
MKFLHGFGFSISAGDIIMKENGYAITSIFDLSNIVALNSAQPGM